MATKNAIDSGDPIEVAAGGTGAATLTDHGVLVGSGTGAVTPLAVGTTNQVLLGSTGADPTWGQVDLANDVTGTLPVGNGGIGTTTLTDHGVLIGSGASAVTAAAVGATGELLVGSTGADPAFGTSADGSFTFTSATAGVTRILGVSNTDNTNSSSRGRIDIQVGGASAGDPYIKYVIMGGVQNFVTGIDNSDSDKWKISASTALGTTDTFVVTPAGEITKPLQPAFLAYLGTDDQNITGDGTAFTLGTGNALTEVFDQNGDFNTNGTFTAPVAGRYFFSCGARFDDLTGSSTDAFIRLVTSNGSYTGSLYVPGPVATSVGTLVISSSFFVDMDASDTATVTVQVSGTTKVVDVEAILRDTHFAGHLVC